jgi:hypothetical protein
VKRMVYLLNCKGVDMLVYLKVGMKGIMVEERAVYGWIFYLKF